MSESERLAEQLQQDRSRLWALAYRILGSTADADDALQEVWLRVQRAPAVTVANPGGWLTTVTSRVCLNMLRARRVRRQDTLGAPGGGEQPVRRALPIDVDSGDTHGAARMEADPAEAAVLAEAVGAALMVLLDRLSPDERIAFILHDVYAVPFEEVGALLGRTPAATRQLASRARRRVRALPADAVPPQAGIDHRRHREVVDAFLSASRHGQLERLVAVLHPSAVLSTDPAVVAAGGPGRIEGRAEVASFFSGKAQVARRASVDGRPGAVWLAGGRPRVIFDFTVVDDLITRIHLVGEPEALDVLQLELIGAQRS